ncbi:lamina-associated polypeptide 2, isoforms alpha/zeta-like [Dendropsophus ebraccatus]|uniref:lamina-associated polypeptide 2, isoforms alpha/zeta-like n=1 Tax=Dendropsophus ebraccatus TaxID=150705 RepID=UPI003831CA2A
MCRKKLQSSYSKNLCNTCITKVMQEEAPSFMATVKTLIKNEIRSSISSDKPSTSTSQLEVSALSPSGPMSPQEPIQIEDEEEGEYRESSDSEEDSAGKALFPIDSVDALVKAVRNTMKVEEFKEQLSVQDKMFEGLAPRKKKVFPLHKNIKDLIQREWNKPDRKFFVPRTLKRKYPFDEIETEYWDRPPMVDPAVAKFCKGAFLPFEDTGVLRDPMDKKADGFLRKSWEATAALFKPVAATTSVARSVKMWLTDLESSIKDGTPRDELIKSLPSLANALDFMSDASDDALRLIAKSTAFSNSARRALWIKDWKGDMASKSRLCAMPCQGQFLFGPALDTVLEKASDRKKGFPSVGPPLAKRPFRGKGRGGAQSSSSRGKNWKAQGKSKNFLFPKNATSKKDDKQ